MHRANAMPPDKLEALIAIHNGGHVTREQINWLIEHGYLAHDRRTPTITGAGQLLLIEEWSAGGGGSTPGSN